MIDDALGKWIASYPASSALPFHLHPTHLYRVTDLYDSYDPNVAGSWNRTYDHKAFEWFIDNGKPRKLSIAEAIAARLHDAFIENEIDAFLRASPGKVVGFMGGHDVAREVPSFRQVALMARTLRRADLQIVTGGGPGLMEAANLGAFLAPFPDEALDQSLETLKGHDFSSNADPSQWISSACAVRATLLGDWRKAAPRGSSNLGIPTWLYGSEPPNLFATAIGKYFYNSVREDGLVTVASGGLVFGPGSAGTVQEIFQDTTLNYDAGAKVKPTPMVFLGKDFWDPAAYDPVNFVLHTHPKPVFPLVQKLGRDATPPFSSYILLSDDPAEILSFLERLNTQTEQGRTLAEARLARSGS